MQKINRYLIIAKCQTIIIRDYRKYFQKSKSKIAIQMRSKGKKISSTNIKSKSPQSKENKNIHKEFQLIYRSKQGQKISKQCESVLFMKHKGIQQNIKASIKASNKNSSNKNNSTKGKKKSQEQSCILHSPQKTQKRFFQADKLALTKSTAPFSLRGDITHKSLFSESFLDAINMQQTKIKKVTNKGNFKSQNSDSTRFRISAQKIKSGKSIGALHSPCELRNLANRHLGQKKKIPKIMASNQNEYVLLHDQFVKASPIQLQKIQKMMTECNKLEQKNQFLQDQWVQTERQKQSISQISHSSGQNPDQVQASDEQITAKILLIQRWWRSMLQKNKTSKSIIGCPSFSAQTTTQERINTNIVLTSMKNAQIQCQKQTASHIQSFLGIREQISQDYMKTQKSILEKLLKYGKMDQKDYSDKISKAESKFQAEMHEIDGMRKMIISQTEKMKILQSKINEENELASSIETLNVPDILNKYFPNDPQQTRTYEGRKKSTGCHQPSENDRENYESECALTRILDNRRQQFNQQSSDQEQTCEPQSINHISNNFQHLFQICHDQQLIQMSIEKRQAYIAGFFQQNSCEIGINTSAVSIHCFLTNFLKFYAYFYKEQFLKFVNMPYGYSPKTRLQILQNGQTLQNEQQQDGIIYGLKDMIKDQTLDDYHTHNYGHIDTSDQEIKNIIELQKIHNKAIIDCFNQSINCFRPYYFVNGPPYLWNYSEKALTFYFITEQNIQEVFEKTEYKVLRNASCACGLLVDGLTEPSKATKQMELQEIIQEYRSCVNPSLAENREKKLKKSQKLDIEQNTYEWQNIQEQKTYILMQLSNILLIELVSEACRPVCQLVSGG